MFDAFYIYKLQSALTFSSSQKREQKAPPHEMLLNHHYELQTDIKDKFFYCFYHII